MKKRLKGLACWWLVLVMLVSTMVTPAMALPSNSIYIYAGTEPLKANDELYPYVREGVSEGTQLSSLVPLGDGVTLTGWNLWEFDNINSGYVITDKLLTKDTDWILSADDVGTYATGEYFAFEPLYAYSANIDVYTGATALGWYAAVDSDDMDERQLALNSALSKQEVLSDLATDNLVGWNFWAVDSGRVSYPEFIEPDGVISVDDVYVDNPSLLEAMYAAALVSTDSNALKPQKSFDYTGPVDLELGTPIDEQNDITGALNRPSGYSLDGWKLWNYGASGWVYETDGGSPKTVSVDHSVTYDEFSAVQDMIGDYRYIVIEPIWSQKYKIDPQPTSDAPTVGAKETTDSGATWNDTDAEYQWHNFKIDTYSVVKTAANESELGAYYTKRANYQDGKWETEWASATFKTAYVEFEALKGDIITVKFDAEFDGEVVEHSSETEYTYNAETDTYTYTVTKDGNVYVYLETDDTTAASEESFTITVTRPVVGDAVSAQTTKTLSSAVDGNQYVCKVTFENGDVLTSDAVTYTAPPTYTVTFDANGGSNVEEQTIETGNKIIEPTEPARTGYTFGGWYKETSCINAWDFENDTVSEPITLYAKWTAYEITQQPTVDNEYEVKVNPSANVAYTWHEMTETDVTMDNAEVYTYNDLSSSYNEGWWTAHSTTGGMDGTPAYFYINLDAGDIVDITLSHSCTARVNIYYNNQAGQKYEDWKEIDGVSNLTLTAPGSARYYMTVSVRDSGEQPTVKAKVIKAGEAIDGQTTSKLTDGVDGTKYVAKITYPDGAVLTSDAVCYVSPSFEVTFDTNGGTNVSKQTVDNGGKVEEPATPTKTGYTFAGWYKDSGLATAWDFNADTVTELVTLYAKWIEKQTIIINTAPQEYVYNNGEPIAFVIDSTLPEIIIEYSVSDADSWSESAPTTAGAYDVRITRAEDDTYKAYSENIEGGLIINKATVDKPDIASKVYNGENQTANVPSSALYTVTSNDGRTNVGTANVVLTLVDNTNYKWSSTEDVSVTVSFAVTKADNAWVTPPSIEGWTYGDNANTPVCDAKFGDVIVEYKKALEDDSAYTADVPTNAGDYNVRFTVNATDDFGSLSEVRGLTIAKQKVAKPDENTTVFTYTGSEQTYELATDARYEITGNKRTDAGEQTVTVALKDKANYTWADGSTTDVTFTFTIAPKSVEGATVGTFVAMTYSKNEQTPAATVTIDGLTATGTWSPVTDVNDKTTFTANGNFTGTITEQSTGMAKATPVVTAPVAKASLIYNTSALALADEGSTTGGTMQYSPDNATWSNDIPTGTNAGDYNVYYKVVGNSNYNDVAAQSISVSIENADMSANITANGYNGVFDNQAHTISVAIPDGASIKYGTDDGTYELVAAPQYTNVETYKVYYKVEKANYNAVTGSADVVITAKDISNAEITLGEALTFNGTAQTQAITSATVDGLTITYDVSGNENTNAGDYTLTISGQGNFTGSKSVSWSIGKASQPAPETPAAVNETIKAKADGKITGVNSDMEYRLKGASEYIAISETEIANLAAGTYLVRYKENANHLAGADKQLVIADGAMITVSFNSNEGTAVDSITCEYNQAITAPAEPTKENFVFAGWYKDAKCLDLWNFGNALTEDITLYAKWNDKPVYSVSGKVTDGESGLGGITVTLKQGNTIIATTTTAADGSYSFITEDGLYNIVAEKEENDNSTIKTVKIEVIESANVNDVVFVATDINSELEIKSDTPQIIVGGLDEEAQTVSSSNGNVDVTVKMTVESAEDITGSDNATGQEQRQTEQKEIKKVSGNRYIQFIEINLTQSISGAESTKLEETSGLIEIIIPFEKGNKRNITVYRYHGSASEKLGAGIGNANADGEYFEVKENHIVVYAKKFSTYAIGYDLPSSGGGGSSVTRYTVKFDTNGGSSVSSATVTKNAKVAEPKTPEKDGYTFGGWYTDEALTEKYDFDSKVTKNFTLYAKWDKHDDEQSSTDTHNCPSLAFDDLDIAKWYHFDTDYVIENGIFKGTTETTFEPDSAQTRAMMVTVLYRVEGEPAVNKSIPFADVDMGAYYANAVIWGQQNGIIKGYSETEFGPDDKITREQIAAIMHRYAQYKGIDVSVGENTNILSYDDFDSISEYAIPSMQWAVGSGLIKGKSESTLNPLDNATRAEIAAILHRFIEANLISTQN